MIGLKNYESIIGFMILMVVYLISIAPAGCFRAWVAKKMGDDTAEELGFLTLNPFVHMDFFGVMVLFLFSDTIRIPFNGRSEPMYTGFGWGKHVLVNPLNIHGRYRWPKLAAALFADSFVHFCLPVLALIVLKLVMISAGPATSLTPAMLLALQFHRAFVNLNVWLLVVEGIVNAVMLGLFYHGRNASLYEAFQISYVALFAPLVIIFLFGGQLSVWISQAITFVGNLIL